MVYGKQEQRLVLDLLYLQVLVQVLEDENQPELVGKILAWKLPKTIFTKMSAKMNPSPESKKAPVAIMDYLIGNPLEIDTQVSISRDNEIQAVRNRHYGLPR